MKIGENAGLIKEIQTRLMSDVRKPGNNGEISFDYQLKTANNKDLIEHIRKMANDVLEQGELVQKHMNLKETQKYKKVISDFFNTVISNNLSFDKNDTLDSRGRYKIYAVINTVDKKLEELTNEVLKDQKDNLAILEKVDVIKGLIINVLL